MAEISVIIPLYGDHPARHCVARVSAAWRRQTTACEVVVVTAGDLGVDIPDAVPHARRLAAGPEAMVAADRR